MYELHDERYPQCADSDIIVRNVVNAYEWNYYKQTLPYFQAKGVTLIFSFSIKSSAEP